jgi:hypothetical protein
MKDATQTKIIFRTSCDLRDRIKAHARANGRTMTGELNHILRLATRGEGK